MARVKSKNITDHPILFIDTSALIKRYIFEDGSDSFQKLFIKAKRHLVSSITLAEVTATFSRLLREGELSKVLANKLYKDFLSDWKKFGILACNQTVEKKIQEIGINSSLRGADLIQFASVLVFKEQLKELVFVVSDSRLINAATDYGLEVINPVKF